jgi:hypothetical protein
MLPRSVLCVQIGVLLLRVTSMYLPLSSQAWRSSADCLHMLEHHSSSSHSAACHIGSNAVSPQLDCRGQQQATPVPADLSHNPHLLPGG